MNKQNKKTTKPSTKQPVATKKHKTWQDEYFDVLGMKTKPVSEAFIERISKELVDWARNNKDAYKISSFFNEKGMIPKTYLPWKKKFQLFSDCYDLAKSIIGNRREIGALERKLDAKMVSLMMPHYDEEWKEMYEYKEKLKTQELARSQPINVMLEQFPSSPDVPEKKIDTPSDDKPSDAKTKGSHGS